MNTIIVRTQADWYAIPEDFAGYTEIHSEPGVVIEVLDSKGWDVTACDNSTWAYGSSTVRACDNSTVRARANVQIVQMSDYAKLVVSGNARTVTPPNTAAEWADYYGLTVRDGVVTAYKAVREDMTSFHDGSFAYAVGQRLTHKCDGNRERDCSTGLHIAHLDWAIRFGQEPGESFRILEVAVPLDKIVVPKYGDGKVRTSELTVIREVPRDEWTRIVRGERQ